MSIAAVDAAPAKMIGQPWSLSSLGQFLDSLQVVTIQWLRTPEVHGNAMLNDSVLVEDLIEDLEGAAAIDHVFEYVRVMTSGRSSSTRERADHGENCP